MAWTHEFTDYSVFLSETVLSFYRSPLKIQNVHFHDIRSEDALNIIESNLDMNTVSFSNVSSDAIDADFSTIKIMYAQFRNIGNDAIDVSGSKGKIYFSDMENVEDKGLSIGEGSRVRVHSVTIKGADIGMASKDSSIIEATNIVVRDSHIGLAAYTKKPEYGPAKLSVTNIKMENVLTPFYIQEHSDFLLDGKIKNDFQYKTNAYDKSSS